MSQPSKSYQRERRCEVTRNGMSESKKFRKVLEDVRAIEAIWLDVIVDDMDVGDRSYRRTDCL